MRRHARARGVGRCPAPVQHSYLRAFRSPKHGRKALPETSGRPRVGALRKQCATKRCASRTPFLFAESPQSTRVAQNVSLPMAKKRRSAAQVAAARRGTSAKVLQWTHLNTPLGGHMHDHPRVRYVLSDGSSIT